MRRFAWIAAVAAVVLGSAQTAQADDGLLEFDLPESSSASHNPSSSDSVATLPPSSDQDISEQDTSEQEITSQPTLSEAPKPELSAVSDRFVGADPLEVSFDLPTVESSAQSQAIASATTPTLPARSPVGEAVKQPHPITQPNSTSSMFDGGSDSLVAKAVGSAEGTRTPNGSRTWAYYGHVDPGNGVWNIGSFSYQHGARTPEEADEKQLRRLQRQAQELRHQAAEKGFAMTLEEELNGIDLANQSPAAALDRGYIVWLNTAHDMGLTGSDAVLWARTRSYLDPDSGRWSAPGLGNNIHSITQDQERRMDAVNQAIALHQQQSVAIEETANRIIFENLK